MTINGKQFEYRSSTRLDPYPNYSTNCVPIQTYSPRFISKYPCEMKAVDVDKLYKKIGTAFDECDSYNVVGKPQSLNSTFNCRNVVNRRASMSLVC